MRSSFGFFRFGASFWVLILEQSALPPLIFMAASPPKILLCGDVLGRLSQLYKRVQSVNKSTGPFHALLCVGQFFPESPDGLDEIASYLSGTSPVSIPTYFIGDYGVGSSRFLSDAAKLPSNKGFKKNGLEVCPNLYWLKGSGKFSLHGLSVVYLSGRQFPDIQGAGRYSRDDVDALRALADEPGLVDIFMTNEWPAGVWNKSDLFVALSGVPDLVGSDPVVAELVLEIKPRYHISGTKDIFYAREAYSNDGVAHVTRFIGLAAVGNKEKKKFIHAISPSPASTMTASEISFKPINCTVSPYVVHSKEPNKKSNNDFENQYWRFDVSKKRPRQDGVSGERLCFKYTSSGACLQGKNCSYRHDDDAREQYHKNVCFDFLNKGKCERGPDCRFRHNLVEADDLSQGGKSKRRISVENCWFCLSSPRVEAHLVLSIGESYYCALAKGPLVQDHVLLIPIEHRPNTLATSSEAEAELEKYKNSLKIYFKHQNKAVIFFEWIFETSPHANFQAVPVPLSKASNVEKIFSFAAKKLGFEFSLVAPSGDRCPDRTTFRSEFAGKSNLFYVELPDGIILSLNVEDKEKFPVQFGREVLAGLLNIAERADWRNCKLSKEEEIQMADNFKRSFQKLDPFS